MARYLTTERLFECPVCYIRCASRELIEKKQSGHMAYNNCPNCGVVMIVDHSGVLFQVVMTDGMSFEEIVSQPIDPAIDYHGSLRRIG